MSVRSVVPSTKDLRVRTGLSSWMSVRSVVPSTPAGRLVKSALVLDECQISSSEYDDGQSTIDKQVLDECQISSLRIID